MFFCFQCLFPFKNILKFSPTSKTKMETNKHKKHTIITTFVVVGKAVIFLPFLNLTVGHWKMDGWETLLSGAAVDGRNPAPVIYKFTRFYHHPRWLFGISEPSTVSRINQTNHQNQLNVGKYTSPMDGMGSERIFPNNPYFQVKKKHVRFRDGGYFLTVYKAGMIVALALLGTAFSFREVHGDEVGPVAGGPNVATRWAWLIPVIHGGFLAPRNGRK